jgi:hypothetical protein
MSGLQIAVQDSWKGLDFFNIAVPIKDTRGEWKRTPTSCNQLIQRRDVDRQEPKHTPVQEGPS